MKKFICALLIFLLPVCVNAANKQINSFSAVGTPASTDQFLIDDAANTTYKITTSQITGYLDDLTWSWTANHTWADNISLILGSDSDFSFSYDSTDDQVEFLDQNGNKFMEWDTPLAGDAAENVINLNPTPPAMDGTGDYYAVFNVVPQNVAHSAGTNYLRGINLGNPGSQTNATATAIQINTGWDYGIYSNADFVLQDSKNMIFGNSSDVRIAFDGATDARLEFYDIAATEAGGIYVSGNEIFIDVNADSQTSGTGAGVYTWNLTNLEGNIIHLSCSDSDGCNVYLAETVSNGKAASPGMIVTLINLGTNVCNFAGSAGIQNVNSAGTFAAGQYDTIQFIYASSQWNEISRSDN